MMLSKKLTFLVYFFITAGFLFAVDGAQDVSEKLADINRAVVSLKVLDSGKNEICQGRGVIVSPEGLLLTNFHLISGAHSAEVLISKGDIRKKVEWEDVFYPGYERSGQDKPELKAKGKWTDVEGIVGYDKISDFALLKIKARNMTFVPLAKTDIFNLGEKLFVIIGQESLSEVSITGLNDFTSQKKIIQVNPSFPPEMTGSPLFNAQGEVIAVTSGFTQKSEIAFPAVYALPLIKPDKPVPLSKMDTGDFLKSSEGLYIKGRTLSLAQDYSKALQCMLEASRLSPDNPDVFSRLGYLYDRTNQMENATAAYRKALGMNPNDYKTAFGLGMSLVKQNRHQEALAPLLQCTQIRPDFPDAFYNLGLTYENVGQLQKAAEAYRQFIKINPGPAWTGYNQLGSVLVKLEQYNQAIPAFQEVLKSNANDIKANYYLAFSYDMSGQYDKAVPLYEKLIQLNPKDARTYYGFLFRLYDKSAQYAKAIETCRKVIDTYPPTHQDFYNLGIVTFKQGSYDQAYEAFNQALAKNSDFELAHFNLGLVFFKKKEYGKALESFLKYDSIKPGNPDALYNIAVAHLQLKKYEDAIAPLQKVIELKPDHAAAHYNLAIAYYACKDRFSAEEEFKKLRTLDATLADKLDKIIHK
ncbi:MAG: tetratricopeptide repeat protein [Candidatus Aminicenantes bacterium]|nr:tetratricopeptide repeat protein [Candidatus Aminicenantes bacterium]